jgi:hypothetical protein
MTLSTRLISFEGLDTVVMEDVQHSLRVEDGGTWYHQNMDIYVSTITMLQSALLTMCL